MLQGVDLITPPVAGIRLDFQSDHTSWRNGSIQENIIKRIRAFYIHGSVLFKWICYSGGKPESILKIKNQESY